MQHNLNETPIQIAIVGAAGYTGAELASIAAAHPLVEVVALFAAAVERFGHVDALVN